MTIFEKIDQASSFRKVKQILRDEFPVTKWSWGSSRIAIPLSEDLVLKVAYNKKGIAQNSTEIDACRHTTEPFDQYLAQIIEYSNYGHWVIQEKVTIQKKNKLTIPEEAIDFLHQSFESSIADLDQLGTIGDRVVIYDYGLTSSIFNQFYAGW